MMKGSSPDLYVTFGYLVFPVSFSLTQCQGFLHFQDQDDWEDCGPTILQRVPQFGFIYCILMIWCGWCIFGNIIIDVSVLLVASLLILMLKNFLVLANCQAGFYRHDSLSTSLFSGTRYTGLILYFLCSSPATCHFWGMFVLFNGEWYLEIKIWVRGVLIVLEVSLLLVVSMDSARKCMYNCTHTFPFIEWSINQSINHSFYVENHECTPYLKFQSSTTRFIIITPFLFLWLPCLFMLEELFNPSINNLFPATANTPSTSPAVFTFSHFGPDNLCYPNISPPTPYMGVLLWPPTMALESNYSERQAGRKAGDNFILSWSPRYNSQSSLQ